MANKKKKIEEEVAESGKVRVSAHETKMLLAKRLLSHMREELENLDALLTHEADDVDIEELVRQTSTPQGDVYVSTYSDRMIEGVFDGEHMVGSDGKQYFVPPNYASKSKLVEGDMLKLSIRPDGSFLFKQIGPIERERVVGELTRDEHTQEMYVIADGKKYHILQASASYYKGEPGDDAVILVPKSAPSRWAAVENIIKRD